MRILTRRPTVRVETLAALAAMYMIALGNGPWWSAVSAGRAWTDPGAWLFVGACFVLLAAAHFVLLALVSNRYTAKPLLALLVIVTAVASYYMQSYNVLLDPTMLRNVTRTDWHETRDLLTWGLAGHVALWCALPLAVIAWVRLEPRPAVRAMMFRGGAIAAAGLLMVGSALVVSRDLTSLMRNQHELRYLITPGNLITSLARNAIKDARSVAGPRRTVGGDARRMVSTAPPNRPRVFVLVLGETARAANFSVLGYGRETNPQLARLGLVTFSDVTACGTSTEVSVPCMFSPYGREDYDEQLIRNSEGLLHVLRRSGLAVWWRDNQSGCKGVCDAPGLDYRKLDASVAPELCSGDECYDEILVRGLAADLEAVTEDTVIVLHMMGNHGPAYHLRYPPQFRRFTPDCRTAQLRECSRQAVVNAYDDAILYTDHVLAEAIETLDGAADRLDTALLYVSDHGESLGEAGLYLHGVPYSIAPDYQTRVPMLMWLSGSFAADARVSADCLKAHAAEPLSHDNLFHSVLGVMDVATTAYRPERDLFAGCRAGTVSLARR
ncbi:MAG: phosphoethanolamine--lipid A transferase [Steroidobacteraceae bacterium]|jgi:lipid A ethanolaminephosphotransferase|nr:phosphoethanolamine--lipid A transferase [Steroidobacteraceae bacterium]